MKELNNKELLVIQGGTNWVTASFLNAASRAVSILLDMGKSLGTSIRRVISGDVCQL